MTGDRLMTAGATLIGVALAWHITGVLAPDHVMVGGGCLLVVGYAWAYAVGHAERERRDRAVVSWEEAVHVWRHTTGYRAGKNTHAISLNPGPGYTIDTLKPGGEVLAARVIVWSDQKLRDQILGLLNQDGYPEAPE